MYMFYYLLSLVVIIVILIIFNNIAMRKIRNQRDIIDDLTMTIENFKTTQQIEEEKITLNQRQFKQEYLQLNFDKIGA